MTPWTFVSRDPEETFAAGRELGRAIGADGVVIALVGPLGAGKTVFVKGLAEGLGLDPRRVSSPTFVIAQQYPLSEGPDVLHHVDLYRLEAEQELEDLGFDDLLAPGAVLAVEWADRFPAVLGRDRLTIEFEGPSMSEADGTDAATDRAPGPGRRAAVSARGREATQVAADWMDRLERRTEGRAADGGFERLSALVVLLMAGLAALASAAELVRIDERATPCATLVEVEADEWGTRRASCGSGDGDATPLRGVARLVSGDRIDLEWASAAWLEALPGIGPARAEAILHERDTRPFERIEDLERVPGIGPITRERLAAFVRVGRGQEMNDGRG